jgi:hypothetical protein
MPYKAGQRLPGERASKLGHLDVIKSELVNRLVEEFTSSELPQKGGELKWEPYADDDEPLQLVFAVDGSLQFVRSDFPPFKELAFIKTALLRLDQVALSKLDQDSPHPLALRDVMADSALYHATVFPMKNVSVPGLSNYHAVRQVIYESMKDQQLKEEPMKTLRWLAYEKWSGVERKSPNFECPHCHKESKGLPYDAETGKCEHCGGEVYLTDMLGFHLDLTDDSASQRVATAYMLIHETLLLFTGLHHFWEQKKMDVLSRCLFIKDGPLSLSGQYVKLVEPIRRLFAFARDKGVEIHMMGQEKSGAFFDHFEAFARHVEPHTFCLLSNDYIRREIQQRPDRGEPYGSRTNYGNKLFVKTDKYHFLVLSVPTGEYVDTTSVDDFIGLKKILGSLRPLVSNSYEGALIPVQLANGVASLSTYPSARILKVFADI